MEIGGINDKINSNTLNNAKEKAVDGEFEKRLKAAYDKKDDEDLKKVCHDFESILLNMMYKGMKATIPKSELFEGDSGKEIFDSMLDDKLMEEASKGRGLGLGDAMYKQLSKQLKTSYKLE